MCGKAIEAICVEKVQAKTLQEGLRKLKDAGIIDAKLYDWAEALRKERNLGAHATGEAVAKEDARDLLEFVVAICDYVYVLAEKYAEYLQRKSRSQAQSKK